MNQHACTKRSVNDFVGFDGDNNLCQIIFCEFFIYGKKKFCRIRCQVTLMITTPKVKHGSMKSLLTIIQQSPIKTYDQRNYLMPHQLE